MYIIMVGCACYEGFQKTYIFIHYAKQEISHTCRVSHRLHSYVQWL